MNPVVQRNSTIAAELTLLCGSSSACLFPECKNTQVQSSTSQDKEFVATSYMIDCGAVGEYNAHIQIRTASDSFSPHGSGEVFALKGPFVATPKWLDGENLLIEVSCQSDSGCGAGELEAFNHPAIRLENWHKVTIHYSLEEKAPPPTRQ